MAHELPGPVENGRFLTPSIIHLLPLPLLLLLVHHQVRKVVQEVDHVFHLQLLFLLLFFIFFFIRFFCDLGSPGPGSTHLVSARSPALYSFLSGPGV